MATAVTFAKFLESLPVGTDALVSDRPVRGAIFCTHSCCHVTSSCSCSSIISVIFSTPIARQIHFYSRVTCQCTLNASIQIPFTLPPSLPTQKVHTPNLRLVVGNDSCDLDSMACALVWSHYLTSTGKATALPVFQCHPDDLPLRTESVWLFQELGVPTSTITYVGSLPADKMEAAGVRVGVTLVDHNSPSGSMADVVARIGTVVEVIDHHRDEGKWAFPCTIHPVGSCSTLVAEKLLGDTGYALDRTVASLLLAAILLDTVNLSQGEGRVTERDSSVAGRLLPLVARQQDEFYGQLLDARLNVSWLTSPQLLMRDFKKVRCGHYVLGFCSVPCLVSDLAQREHFNGDCHQFCLLQGTHALILLGSLFPKEGPKRRQIGLYQPRDEGRGVSRDFAESISSVLETQEVLNSEHLSVPAFEGVVLEQRNVLLSRKQIIPMIADFLAAV